MRSREKVEKDYNGHANKLKDLSRLTLRFTQPASLARALKEFKDLDLTVVILKNKYANPTPMGYSDFNLVVSIKLASGVPYLCEIQLNLQQMLDAKSEAHEHYEVIRKRLPELCQGTSVEADVLEVRKWNVS